MVHKKEEGTYDRIPVSFFLSFFLSLSLSFSLSLSLSGYFFGAQRLSEFTFLPGILRPSREGALHLHPIKRAPEASMNRASPVPGALLAFCINQRISASFSFTFLLVDSGPLGSGPLKDLNKTQHSQINFFKCISCNDNSQRKKNGSARSI